MKLYTGVDIVEIDRIKLILERYGDRFLNKVFTPSEIAFANSSLEKLSSRFAAKESFMKALNLNSRRVPWKSIEVCRIKGSAPKLKLSGQALEESNNLNLSSISLSLSHTSKNAIAFVVAFAK